MPELPSEPVVWQTVRRERAFDTRFFKVRKDSVILPDGSPTEYYIHDRGDGALICCLTLEGKVLFVRQYRHPLGAVVLELPAGLIEPGEDPAAAIRRELLEEVGYAVGEVYALGSFVQDPGNSPARVHLFFGKGAHSVQPPKRDPREIVVAELVDPSELERTPITGVNSLLTVQLARQQEFL